MHTHVNAHTHYASSLQLQPNNVKRLINRECSHAKLGQFQRVLLSTYVDVCVCVCVCVFICACM